MGLFKQELGLRDIKIFLEEKLPPLLINDKENIVSSVHRKYIISDIGSF